MIRKKTANELKDSNSHNAAEIFKHLLENKSDAFSFTNDGKGSKEANNATIDHPINLDNTPTDLVIDDSDDEGYQTANDFNPTNNGAKGSAHTGNTDAIDDVSQMPPTKNTEYQDAWSEASNEGVEEKQETTLDGNLETNY